MKKIKVVKTGNSLTVTIPKAYAELLELEVGNQVEVDLEMRAKQLKIRKVK